MSNQQVGNLQFIHMSRPDDAVGWRRQVRSHVARQSLARQQRVRNYPNMKFGNLEGDDTSTICSLTSTNAPPGMD